MNPNFLAANELVRVGNAVAAGTGDSNSSRVSTARTKAVTFIALLGTVASTGVPSMKIQGTNDGGSNYDDLVNTSVAGTDADDNKMLAVTILEPTYTELRAVVGRATANVTIDGVLAIRHERSVQPITQGSTVAASETHLSPAAGTA